MIRWLWKIFIGGFGLLFSIGNLGALAAGRRASKRLLDDAEISSLSLLEKELALRYVQLSTQEEKLRSLIQNRPPSKNLTVDLEREVKRLEELRRETAQLLHSTWRAKGVVAYRRILQQTVEKRPRYPSTSVAFIPDFELAAQEFRTSAAEWQQYTQYLHRRVLNIPRLSPPSQGREIQNLVAEVAAERTWVEEAIQQEMVGAKLAVDQLNLMAEWCQAKTLTDKVSREPIHNPMDVLSELEEFEILLPTADQMKKIEGMASDIEAYGQAEQEVDEALRRYIPARSEK